MIDKSTNATVSSNADVPRVGGEDNVRGCDLDFRVAAVDDAREVVDDQTLSASVAEKS